MNITNILAAGLALAGILATPRVHADAVIDWNAALDAAQKASGQTSSSQSRSGAIVHAAIFDAINGIAREYTPYFVTEAAPDDARQDAAAVQAAYTTLTNLYPAQKALFDAQREASLAGIPGHQGNSQSIALGLAWGDHVAKKILDWRASDGFATTVTFFGSDAIGYWRAVPTGGVSGVNVQFATMVPFTMTSPSQFRPGPPYGSADRLNALASAVYAADVNEVKALGRATGSTRTEEQTQLALFWHATDIADQNRALRSLVSPKSKLVQNARLFALANLACGDASIAVYDSKYTYALWRPYHAIRLAAEDGNPATDPDPSWTPLVATPRHPEYLSAHSIISGAMLGAAALVLGNEQTFTLSTPGFPSLTRTYDSFTSAADEVVEARIYIGFHFRTACEVGRDTGFAIAEYVVGHFLLPLETNEDNDEQ
jgi:hypothetical protein